MRVDVSTIEELIERGTAGDTDVSSTVAAC